jgi:hypothetical protein
LKAALRQNSIDFTTSRVYSRSQFDFMLALWLVKTNIGWKSEKDLGLEEIRRSECHCLGFLLIRHHLKKYWF